MNNRSIIAFIKFKDTAALYLFVLASLVLVRPAFSAEIIWEGDFETGDFSQFTGHLLSEGTRSSKKIVTSPVRAGKYATELVIKEIDDPNAVKNRAELMTYTPETGGIIRFHWDGPEYWVGFSFFFQEWDADAWTFFQIHSPNEPKGSTCDWEGNALTLYGMGSGDNDGVDNTIALYVLENGGQSKGGSANANNSRVANNPLETGVWHDYVMNFRLSTEGTGFFKVWKNDEVIYSKTDLTNVNYLDSCGQPIVEQKFHNGVHIGLYASKEAQYRRIFYDEVRVAEGSNGYSLVAPGGGSVAQDTPPVKRPLPPQISGP